MAEQAIKISGLPADTKLEFESMTGWEELGRLFELKLNLLSEKKDITLDAVLGPISVAAEQAGFGLPNAGEHGHRVGLKEATGLVDGSGGRGRTAVESTGIRSAQQ